MPINLPNGNDVEEIVLPNGANASEVYGPNGKLVWEGTAIPDSDMYWAMDEGSGTTLADSSGSISGTLVNAGWSTDADFGNITTYDGVDGRAESDAGFWINETEVSVAMWIRIEPVSDDTAILNAVNTTGGNAADGGWQIQIRDSIDRLAVRHGDGTGASVLPFQIADVASIDGWIMVGVSISGDTAEGYVYTTTEKFGSASGSGTRETASNVDMWLFDSGDPALAGDSASFRAYQSTLAESDFDSIWQATRP